MPGDSPAQIGRRIRALRKQRGLSQRDVADPAITTSYLSLIESGQRLPSREILEHIAARLETEPQEILTGHSPALEAEMELVLQEIRRELQRGELPEAEKKLKETDRQAKRHGLKRVQAISVTLRGLLREQQDDLEEALDLFQYAQRLWDEYGAAHLKFEAIAGEARCELRFGKARDAVYILNSYLMELESSGVLDPTAQMRVYSALVPAYNLVGLPREAASAAEQAMKLANQVEEPEQIACMNMNVARTLLNQGRYEDALDAVRKAEQLFVSLDWPLGAARALINRGIVEFEKKNLDDAREAYESALLKLQTVSGSEINQAAVLNELGRIHRIGNDVPKATETLASARELMGDERSIFLGFNQRETGRCLVDEDAETAVSEYYSALETYRLLGAREEFATTALELARELRTLGRVEESLQIFESGLEITLESEPVV